MHRQRIMILLAVVVIMACGGIIGYAVIEDWSLLDAVYMTAITLTTVGYGEVHKLSDSGKIFTVVLLIFGVGTVAFSATTTMSYILSIDFNARRRKKMEARMKDLKDHVIVCGYGRMGSIVCQELKNANKRFVVIEKRVEVFKKLDELKFDWVEGDATDDECLARAGIKLASYMVSMVDNDHDALYLSLAARTLNPNIYIVIRANSDSARKKILMTGADKVVLPYYMSGVKVAQSIINPNIEDFLEIAGIDGDTSQRFQLVDIHIKENSSLVDKTLKTCGIRRDGLIVVGIKKSDNSFIFAPDASRQFKAGECLIALGTRESYEKAIKSLEQ